MNKITCYILDDLKSQFKFLEMLIRDLDCLILEGTSTDPIQFIGDFNAGTITATLLFLDIDMPGISGLEIADLLKGRVEIIFTTAHRSFAPEAFELNAVDYLLKPIRKERFMQAVEKCYAKKLESTVISSHGVITIPGQSKGSYHNLKYADIVFIKSDSNYMTLMASGKKYMFISSLERLEQQLPAKHFIRIHRSFIVNIHHIQAIKGNHVNIGSENLIIGRTYRKSVLPRLIRND